MADERRGKAFEVTPEEARFLHRFVRRTVLPWFAGVGALAGLALGVALSPAPPVVRVEAAPDVQASAAQDDLRAEIARLRDELGPRLAKLEASLARRPEPAAREADETSSAASSAELTSIRDRLYDLERTVQSAAAAPAAPAPAASPE
ncbi:MAG TPA: hypothetical protein VII72_18100 [Myxococcota bacterium]|jgi:ElaB/YqjD/DUF883 family membrane-anchored ribosome-binding protein